MAEPNSITNKLPSPPADAIPDAPKHEPYVPDSANMHEFTWPSLLLGACLGILFGASSLYLWLKDVERKNIRRKSISRGKEDKRCRQCVH